MLLSTGKFLENNHVEGHTPTDIREIIIVFVWTVCAVSHPCLCHCIFHHHSLFCCGVVTFHEFHYSCNGIYWHGEVPTAIH